MQGRRGGGQGSRGVAVFPLAQREVGDLVTLQDEALGKAAVPPLGAPDGVREQTVIDQADPHGQTGSLGASLGSLRTYGSAVCLLPILARTRHSGWRI